VKSIVTLFIFLVLSAQTCKKVQTDLPAGLFRHWVHSFEEDAAGLQTYRPATYSFPVARGREGFQLKEDGTFILHRTGPADGIEKVNATWKALSENTFRVELQHPDIAPYTIQIIQATDTVLTLKKINN
jgi:hypothetical protein